MYYDYSERSPILRLLAALGVLAVAVSLLFFVSRFDVNFFTFVLTPIVAIGILGIDTTRKSADEFLGSCLATIILFLLFTAIFFVPIAVILLTLNVIIESMFGVSSGTFLLLLSSIFFAPLVGVILLSIEDARRLFFADYRCHSARAVLIILFALNAYIAVQCLYTIIS